MLTNEMRALIANFSAGAVATINEDRTPSVSPKSTFIVLGETQIVFGDIRSPGTVRNLKRNPAIEVCFTDILARRALRVSGKGRSVPKSEADATLLKAYGTIWAPYIDHVRSFVIIDIVAAELINSPAYDVGFSEASLRETNLSKLTDLA